MDALLDHFHRWQVHLVHILALGVLHTFDDVHRFEEGVADRFPVQRDETFLLAR